MTKKVKIQIKNWAGDYFAGEVDNRVDEVLDFTKQNIKKLKVVANK